MRARLQSLSVMLVIVLSASWGGAQSLAVTVNGSPSAANVPLASLLLVQLDGTPGLPTLWAFDAAPGPISVGGVPIPIGLSPAFFTLWGTAPLPASGNLSAAWFVSQSLAALVGLSLYTVGVGFDAAQPQGLVVSNGASITFISGGPQNPMPPDAVFVVTQSGPLTGLACINTAAITTPLAGPGTSAPVAHGTTVTGTLQLSPTRLAGSWDLALPRDLEVGAWIGPPATNNIANPGRGPTQVPGVPDPGQATTPTGLLSVVGIPTAPPVAPWGNYLYAVDEASDAVKVFNGHSFELITTLTGTAGPRGLGIAPNLSSLYVSNLATGTLTRFDTDPSSPTFHALTGIIFVGNAPNAVSVQPAGEDVLVANTGDNTVSIIDTTTQAVRTTMPTGNGPTDIFVTDRMIGTGLTNAYTAFITNFFDDTVTVYESDTPVAWQNSPEGEIKATVAGFSGPGRGCWNWNRYITSSGAPGAFIVNQSGTTVDELVLSNFTLSAPPGFGSPPGSRNYTIAQSLDASTDALLASASPSDVVVENHSGRADVFVAGTGNHKSLVGPELWGGVTSVVLVSYPSLGVVAAWDSGSPTLINTVSVPGCDSLHSYYDQ